MLLVSTILMAVGAVIDHHHFVLPLQKQLSQIQGAQAQHTADVKIENQKVEVTQNEVTTKVQTDYASMYANLLARMHKPATPNIDQHLPSPSQGAIQVAGAVPESSVSATDTFCTSSTSDPCEVSRVQFNGAILDAARLDSLLEWVAQEKFPVSAN